MIVYLIVGIIVYIIIYDSIAQMLLNSMYNSIYNDIINIAFDSLDLIQLGMDKFNSDNFGELNSITPMYIDYNGDNI